MLLGENGSGKSTIMSCLHPFKETFDERKTYIIQGLEGRKEIDIEHDNHLYEIVHIYGIKPGDSQSFIKKDGTELNPSGGVNLCIECIKNELGITKDFFKIGKIGSNTSNFVSYKSTDRKNYVGTFLDIEDMISKFNIVKSKYNVLKKELTAVANELKNYESSDILNDKISKLSAEISDLESRLIKILPKQGSLKANIERDIQDIGTADLEILSKRKSEKEQDIQSNQSIKDSVSEFISNVETLIEDKEKLENEIRELESQIKVNNSEMNNINLLITDTENKISSLKIEMENLGNPKDIENLKNDCLTLNTKIEELKDKIRKNPYGPLVNQMRKNKADISKYLNLFITFTNFIEKYFPELQNKELNKLNTNIELFFEKDFDETIERLKKQSRETIDGKEKLLSEKQTEKIKMESHICQLENLEKRPKQCNIDDCPFIKDALLHKNVLSEIKMKEEEISKTKEDLDVLNLKAENIQNISNIYKLFKSSYEDSLPRTNEILIEFLKKKSIVDWVNGSLSEFQKERQIMIEYIDNAIENMNDFVSKLSEYKNKNLALKALTDNDSSFRNKYETELKEYENKKTDLDKSFKELENKGKEFSINMKNKRELLEKYNMYVSSDSAIKSARSMLSTANTEIKKLTELYEHKANSEKELELVNTEIDGLTNLKNKKTSDLSIANSTLGKVTSLTERKKEIDKNIQPTEAIFNALNPSSGIPLILIKMYLEETEQIANELLDIAYNGDFKIKFVTTEKDFNIEVIAKDNVKPDIRDASQGEIALTTLSISLALIEQSIGAYNILCLDEIDGPLDISNRANFINILDSQIDKLGIEQVFVISHNNAFDTCAMDLVLLKGNAVDKDNTSFFENKNIIFDYETI